MPTQCKLSSLQKMIICRGWVDVINRPRSCKQLQLVNCSENIIVRTYTKIVVIAHHCYICMGDQTPLNAGMNDWWPSLPPGYSMMPCLSVTVRIWFDLLDCLLNNSWQLRSHSLLEIDITFAVLWELFLD